METLRKLKDIDKSIQILNRTLSQTVDNHPSMQLLYAHLGTAHDHRFDLLNELNDLEKAIKYKTIALTMTSENDPGLSRLLSSLAAVHYQRFEQLGDQYDIEKAIEHGRMSVELTTDSDSALGSRLKNLGTYYTVRFQRLDNMADLEDAIRYQSRTLALTPDRHPDLPRRLTNLGVCHYSRFERLGELSDIENAIKYKSRALVLTPDGHSGLPAILANLGVSHRGRFERLGERSDIENAIKYKSRALALTPGGHPELPRRLQSLGVSHYSRFERLGELSDVEDAIEYHSRALNLTPDGHPHLPGILTSLGLFHNGRFEHLGELSDLESAIDCQSRALSLTHDGHPDLPAILANLGMSHRGRFERLGELSDIENAIKYKSRAVALTPDGHPGLPHRLTNLGVSHGSRFKRLGELSDLESAIKYQSRALVLTPDGHPYLPILLADLAASHKGRFKQLSDLSDLDHAMRYESRTLALTPNDHPDASKWQFNHANTHLCYYQLTRNKTHLEHSLDFFRSAARWWSGVPRDKFRNAQTWAHTAFMHQPDDCIEAYQTAIDLLPQFIWLGATTKQRYEDLSITEALAVDAAYAAIRSSDYALALEWLEHARCVVWNQSLMLRSPIDKLHSVSPDLAIRLQAIALQLNSAGSDSRESRPLASDPLTAEQVARQHHQLATEYNDMLSQIRQRPGFDDFLRPMKAGGLIRAARTGPVVVINCHKAKCDALLILPGKEVVEHVSLPNFSALKAQEARQTLENSLRYKGVRARGVKVCQEPDHKDGMPSVLATLWDNVVKPIIDYLGLMNSISSASMPHITWCPTGALSFLPLHAAGNYTQPRSRVFDYVISSYTPTLAALLASSPDSLSNSCRLLAVGQANTPGQSKLPGTARELAYIQAHMTNSAQYSQLIGSDGTVATVLKAMEQHDWVHLACHAHQNYTDPTKSGFFLHDGTLDLAEINRRSFKGKGLAFLSACQTATGDERLADEAVHLASGMLMAGYASVIGTMWSVHDADAPVVANKVYAQLMKDKKIGRGEAGRALHNAVATLRESIGEDRFERWVPYIHIGS